MKKVIVSALAIVLALSLMSCDKKAKTEVNAEEVEVVADDQQTEQTEEATVEKRKTGKKLRNVSDSISYAIGANLAKAIMDQSDDFAGDINVKYLFAGIKETFKERGTLADNEIMTTIQNYFMNVVPERKLVEGEKFLAQIEKETAGIQKTESGLLYVIENPGSEVKPLDIKDTVEVNYVGTLLRDGTEFDSSYKRNSPAKFALGNVIKGWSEGIMHIGEGGKIKLWIPSELAYGKMGGGRMIGPNEPIVFEVELLHVMPFVDTEAETK